MNNTQITALKASAILWVIWGVVHAFFGIAIMAVDTSQGFAYIAAGVVPETLSADYHSAIGAILNQHAWNLLWFGVVTTFGGIMIWRRNMTAIWVSAMVGGTADLGYLIFVDFGGFATFFPGTFMTLIAGSAIFLSGWVWLEQRKNSI
ncbi:hypothetical protein [Thalassotalea aquiviva]|uniref:hypothetical protein n=1 Tax=Thalassotalea aquiviva TaxID=3242415 RepID=UPI00352A78B7